jgi:DNA-binding CsgD family transcriptional regulator
MLYGRDAELAVVDALLDTVRSGGSGALVLRGEPGIGKTALLDHAAAAPGVRVLRGQGIASEAELPFAGLHLLLRPVLDRVDALPAVQAGALRGALGLAPAATPDPFLVGLAVLSLLSEAAEPRPLVVLVDDLQWLDRVSAEALLFAARRLDADAVALLFAARDEVAAPGVPELRLDRLDPAASATLLAARAADLRRGTREWVLAEAAGNPLALIEMPAALAEFADRPGTPPLPDRLRDAFEAQVRRLPEPARTALLVAALDDTGRLDVVLRAATRLGATVDDLDAGGLVRTAADGTIAFRHPLVRAAVVHDAPLSQRFAVHGALAAALDGPADADRRAWHLASATTGPDEQVAAELERTAAWAGERSGHAAAAAAYQRSAELTADPPARLRRLVLAAEAAAEAGDLDRAESLAAAADRSDITDPELLTRLTTARAAMSFSRGSPRTAYRQLVRGAAAVSGTDPQRAAMMLIEAVHNAWYSGERELADAAARLRALHLDAADPIAPLSHLTAHAIAPILSSPAGEPGSPPDSRPDPGSEPQTDSRPGPEPKTGPGLRAGSQPDPAVLVAAARQAADDPATASMIAAVCLILGQDSVTIELADEQTELARRQGRIGWLPHTMFYLACGQFFGGWHREARATVAEAVAIARDTDQPQWVDRLAEARAYLAAVAGEEQDCRELTDRALAVSAGRDPAWHATWAYWARGLLDLGLGRAEQALSHLLMLAEGRARFYIPATRSTPDLVEAAVRAGRPDAAAEAFTQYQRWARHARRPWIDAVVLRCRALFGPDADAGTGYEAALDRHRSANRPFETARTALLYGEWLRRARRRTEARAHLTAALGTFEGVGAAPWAARARTELGATGAVAPEQPVTGALAALTPQERQIVRLAATGLSNKDIAAQLFLSPRTVGYHLYKAYPKLGIVSRAELAGVLAYST